MIIVTKGSSKSGNFGHAGRPGKIGGSAPGNSAPVSHSKSGQAPTVDPNVEYYVVNSGKYRSDVPEDFKALAWLSKPNPGTSYLTDVWDVDNTSLEKDITKHYGEWYGANFEDRGNLKNSLCETLSTKAGVEYNTVNEILGQWAESSNSDNIRSLTVQRVVAETFGEELSDWQKGQLALTNDKVTYFDQKYEDKKREWVENKRIWAKDLFADPDYSKYSKETRDKTTLYRTADDATMMKLADESSESSGWHKQFTPHSYTRWDSVDDEDIAKTAKAMYNHTQAELAKAGFKPGSTIRLFRGINITRPWDGTGQEHQ